MEALSATEARGELFKLIKNAVKKHQQFQIHHRLGEVVLLSREDYESLIETLELLSAPNFRRKYRRAQKDIKEGNLVPFNEVFGS